MTSSPAPRSSDTRQRRCARTRARSSSSPGSKASRRTPAPSSSETERGDDVNPLRWAKAEVLHLAWKQGRYTPPDRRLFEGVILRAIAADDANQRILSVGVAWYTKGYSSAFTGKTFVTLDVDESRAAFATTKHIVGDLRDLERHFGPNEPFDVILMNGVIG